jgi:hypothetical protein
MHWASDTAARKEMCNANQGAYIVKRHKHGRHPGNEKRATKRNPVPEPHKVSIPLGGKVQLKPDCVDCKEPAEHILHTLQQGSTLGLHCTPGAWSRWQISPECYEGSNTCKLWQGYLHVMFSYLSLRMPHQKVMFVAR